MNLYFKDDFIYISSAEEIVISLYLSGRFVCNVTAVPCAAVSAKAVIPLEICDLAAQKNDASLFTAEVNGHNYPISTALPSILNKPYIDKLVSAVNAGRWEVYSVKLERGAVCVFIGLVLPLPLQVEGFHVTCNGQLPKVVKRVANPYFKYSYWFMPSGCVLGLELEYVLDGMGGWLEFNISFENPDCYEYAVSYRAIYNFTSAAMMQGLPSNERIHRVSSVNSSQVPFLNSGKSAFERLKRLAWGLGVDFDSSELKILDWGVGCGRVIRHFSNLCDRKVWGVDIDASNVQWCNENLKNVNSVANLNPPTSFDSDFFDVIYSCSVLSHLDEKSIDAWLGELARILSPNGVGLFSFNGSSNSASYLSRRRKEFESVMNGVLFDGDINHDLDNFIPSTTYYRATFASDAWWKDRFSRFFKIESIEKSVVSGDQNIAVLKRL